MVPEVTRNYNPTEMGGRAWNNLWWVPVKLSRQTYFCLDVFGWTNIITSYLYRIKFPIIRSVNDSKNKVSSPPRIWSDKALHFWPDIVHWLAVQAQGEGGSIKSLGNSRGQQGMSQKY